jgi:hypothetical protein
MLSPPSMQVLVTENAPLVTHPGSDDPPARGVQPSAPPGHAEAA